MSLQDLVILGAGGFAKEVAMLVDQINADRPQFNLLGFIDENQERVGTANGKYLVIGTEALLSSHPRELAAVIGIGTPGVIAQIAARIIRNPRLTFPNLVHPSFVGDRDRIQLGRGNIICAGNIFTTDISVGSFCIFNLHCTVGHDCRIGNHCVLNPGVNVSGSVIIEDDVLLGTNCSILQGKSLGAGAQIGAGAVVVKPVAPATTVVGVPARPVG